MSNEGKLNLNENIYWLFKEKLLFKGKLNTDRSIEWNIEWSID